jgi:hypothetical protein
MLERTIVIVKATFSINETVILTGVFSFKKDTVSELFSHCRESKSTHVFYWTVYKVVCITCLFGYKSTLVSKPILVMYHCYA